MIALAAACALARMGPAGAQAAPAPRTLRILLNTGLSGPVAFFLVAQERNYLREAGLQVQWSGGPGAAAMGQIADGGHHHAARLT